jgi:hypothetical protein
VKFASSPLDLDHLIDVAQSNLRTAAQAAGIWEAQYEFGAKIMAEIVSRYCHRAATGADAGDMEESRDVVRDILFNWRWTDPGAPMPPLRSDGIDPDAARLCGFPEDRFGTA